MGAAIPCLVRTVFRASAIIFVTKAAKLRIGMVVEPFVGFARTRHERRLIPPPIFLLLLFLALLACFTAAAQDSEPREA